jgi:hypothetical protein
MNFIIDFEKIKNACESSSYEESHQALISAVSNVQENLNFNMGLIRGGWHRPGAVVDAQGNHIADDLASWAEQTSGGDVNVLLEKIASQNLFATRLTGKTLYLVAPIGDKSADFVQLEIEQIQEVMERPLWHEDWLPEDLGEFIDPLDPPKFVEKPLKKPVYHFRQINYIPDLLAKMDKSDENFIKINRFLSEWDECSASEMATFCEHWAFALRKEAGYREEILIRMKPISTHLEITEDTILLEEHRGAKLANLIHSFDRKVGYPFAWYFFMLTNTHIDYNIAEAVFKDLMGAYDYLPVRDLKILRRWHDQPYGL